MRLGPGLLGTGLFGLLLLFSGGGGKAPSGGGGGGADPLGLRLSEDAIRGLDAAIQPLARALIRRAWDAGIPVVVGSGTRSIAEQDALYAQGRTKPGPIVTDARGGSSWHNFGLAFDLAILSPDGKYTYPNDVSLWTTLGQMGEALGLAWGGRAAKPDWDHFDYHPGMTLADARAGVRPDRLA